ncbi:MAG: cytochrome c [Ferruginibacter sp.]
MKRYLPFFLLLIVFNSACNNKATPVLNSNNLESSFISIDPDSSYTLKTGKGATVKIAAGTFKTGQGKKVEIEIKEAFSMRDILLAGLTTYSNGRPLQSGGMIYFNASSEGRELEFNKPVNISIPSDMYDPAMQLFKGDVQEDSSINWIEPQPLDTTPSAATLIKGEQLFKHSCANCHKIRSEYTGTALGLSLQKAPGKQWLYDFIHNPTKMIATDAYAKELFKKWGPAVMNSFSSLTNKDIDAIYDYIENEKRLHPDSAAYEEYLPERQPITDTPKDDNIDTLPDPSPPCGFDTLFYPSELSEITDITNSIQMPDTLTPAENMEFLRNGFSDPIFTEKMYDFSITTNGWYNVDAFVEGLEGTENITVQVGLKNPFKAAMNVYLFSPERKLLSVGVDKGNNIFGFDKINGKIPLFKNDNAILLAFGSNNSQLYYGIRKFRIAAEQSLSIDLAPTTEENLKSMISRNSIEGIELDTYKKGFEVLERPCNGTDSTSAKK